MAIKIDERIGTDGKIYVKIHPLDIETYGTTEADLRIAIVEAVLGFTVVHERDNESIEEFVNTIVNDRQ